MYFRAMIMYFRAMIMYFRAMIMYFRAKVNTVTAPNILIINAFKKTKKRVRFIEIF